MNLYLQDPTYSSTYTLHEALLNSCINSSRGGAAYAFVSLGGVKLLLEDKIFSQFMTHSKFKLIVGTDEITSEKALNQLESLTNSYSNFEVKAFYHKIANTLFHPKFCWFKKRNGGLLVLGSGNLTEKGLRRNWEAFNVIKVSETEIKNIETQWNEWIFHNSELLKSINDEEVILRVKNNAKIYRKIKKDIVPNIDSIEEIPALDTFNDDNEDIEAWQYGEFDSVLIAEIPRASNRWNQANFNKDTFINYFGATPGDNSLRILLRSIKTDSSLGDIETRPSISVKSHNWRFELKLAASLAYPDNDRPIGIFIRVSRRMFLYMIAMPNLSYYNEVISYLNSIMPLNNDNIRRCLTDVQNLRNNCPNLPIWQTNL